MFCKFISFYYLIKTLSVISNADRNIYLKRLSEKIKIKAFSLLTYAVILQGITILKALLPLL